MHYHCCYISYYTQHAHRRSSSSALSSRRSRSSWVAWRGVEQHCFLHTKILRLLVFTCFLCFSFRSGLCIPFVVSYNRSMWICGDSTGTLGIIIIITILMWVIAHALEQMIFLFCHYFIHVYMKYGVSLLWNCVWHNAYASPGQSAAKELFIYTLEATSYGALARFNVAVVLTFLSSIAPVNTHIS